MKETGHERSHVLVCCTYLAGASGSLLPLLPQAGLQPPRNQPQDGCPHNSAPSRKFLSSWVYRTKYQSWAPASGFLLMRHHVNDRSGKKHIQDTV